MRRSETRPSAVGCQPFVSISPSAATSAATTMWPVVPASLRPFASTIGPRGPARSTVRYAWPFASDVYAGPCRIWIDQARSTRRQSAMPTSDREPADADEEARAAEERRVGARVRLEPAAAGEGARELDPAPGIGGREWLRRLRLVGAIRPTCQCRDALRRPAIRRRARPRAGRAEASARRAQARPGAAATASATFGRPVGLERAQAPAARASRRSGESSSSASRSAATESRSSSRCGSPPAARTNIARRREAFSSASSIGTAPSTSQASETSSSRRSAGRGPRRRAPLAGVATTSRSGQSA